QRTCPHQSLPSSPTRRSSDLTDQTGSAKPANHIPTSAPCAQCHTTAGNSALYSVTGTHQGVTDCLSCHGPTVGPFANVTMVTSRSEERRVGKEGRDGYMAGG